MEVKCIDAFFTVEFLSYVEEKFFFCERQICSIKASLWVQVEKYVLSCRLKTLQTRIFCLIIVWPLRYEVTLGELLQLKLEQFMDQL